MFTRKKNNFGFTLIELLVVVAIIGLLSSIISVALGNSRTKARDTRRITDLKQIKTGMDLYYSLGSGYPETTVWDAAVGGNLLCAAQQVMQIPRDPSSPGFGYEYDYTAAGTSTTGCGGTVRSEYEVEFYIENQGGYFFMDEDGNVFDSDTGAPVGFDGLL